MPAKIIVPWNFTDHQIADYAAKYFFPHGVPADVKFERAQAPDPTPDQMNCGYCLYGPPALCTCGTCDVEEDEGDYPFTTDELE